MRKLNTEEVKQIQLEILKHLQAWCIEHDVSFWLDCGSLLGAIRHKGYIPWDDDIDVGMLRPDYDRLLSEFNADNTVYKCYSVENDSTFGYPFAKVLDTRTVLYEPDESGEKLSINIDVFVYDNVPDDDAAVKKIYRKRDILWIFRQLQICGGKSYSGGTVKKAVVWLGNLFFRLFPSGFFEKRIVANSKKYIDVETERIGSLFGNDNLICDKSVFDDFIYTDFEGTKMRVPADYDTWLTAMYGDYMQLPPIEDRITHHLFVAYVED